METGGVIYTSKTKFTKAKAWAAAVTTVAMAFTAVFADNVIGVGEVGTFISLLIEAGMGVATVYGVTNKPIEQ